MIAHQTACFPFPFHPARMQTKLLLVSVFELCAGVSVFRKAPRELMEMERNMGSLGHPYLNFMNNSRYSHHCMQILERVKQSSTANFLVKEVVFLWEGHLHCICGKDAA